MKKKNNEIVFDFLKEKIIKKYWKEGDKIYSENEISSMLGVSRNSVREAIEKMVALEVLTKKRGGGTYVNSLDQSLAFNNLVPMVSFDENSYKSVLSFRRGFETQNVELFIENSTDEDIVELEEVYKKMHEFKEREEFSFYDAEFHNVIARGTKNPIIIKISEVLNELLIHHQKDLNKILGSENGIKEHALIMASLKKRDKELSKLYMLRHIERTIKDVESK